MELEVHYGWGGAKCYQGLGKAPKKEVIWFHFMIGAFSRLAPIPVTSRVFPVDEMPLVPLSGSSVGSFH